MIKETSHRGQELEALGWSKDDVLRYSELWDYRQRWGAINLERDDRLFLRKAEATLPKITSGKTPVRKSLKEKSYYRWLTFYLDSMNDQEKSFKTVNGSKGIWPILLEEELRAIEYYEPVLGLPDTLKAKALDAFRETFVIRSKELDDKEVSVFTYDFQKPLEDLKLTQPVKWRSLAENIPTTKDNYPVLLPNVVEDFRKEVRTQLVPFIRNLFPSLSDTEKTEPPDDWTPKTE